MSTKKKRSFGIFLVLAMALGLMLAMSQAAYAATNYDDYIPSEEDGEEELADKVVNFNGHKWYIISNEGETITLLAADTSFGIKRFTDGNENDYFHSKIRESLDGMTAKGGSFEDVADAIEEISIPDTAGTAKLYLLNVDEVSGLPINVVRMNYTEGDAQGGHWDAQEGQWWLRSPDPNQDGNSMCAYVKEVENEYSEPEEKVIIEGKFVEHYFGVRPALQLNKAKVIFDSTSKTFSIQEYPLWVGGTQVTSANAVDTEGTRGWSYTPATTGATPTPAILTLSGYSYEGEGYAPDASDAAAIYAKEDLTIELKGTNTVTNADQNSKDSYGVYADKNLTITGSGTLIANAGNTDGDGSLSTGIFANASLTIEADSTVKANGGNSKQSTYGIFVASNLNVQGTLEANGDKKTTNGYGVYSISDSVIGASSTVTAVGSTQAIDGNVKNAIPGTGWTDVEGKTGEAVIEKSETGQDLSSYKKVQFNSHTHSFTYAAGTGANANTITATCTAEGCTLPPSTEGGSDHVATLTIGAPLHTTYGDGKEAAAIITDDNSIQGDAKVSYFKTKKEADTDIKGDELSAAPTDAGKFWAEITLGPGADDKTATAHLVYDIAKADPTANAPTGLTATYGQTLANVSLEGKNPEGNTAGTWAWVDAATTSVGSVGSNTFKANFTPQDTDNYKAAENVDVTVTVNKAANPATVTGTASVANNGYTVDLSNNVKLNGATGEVSYAISGEAKGCSLNGSVLTSGDAAGEVTVNVTVAADSNYEALAATPITVTIVNKGTQTITADDVAVTYGDTDKAVSANVTDPAEGGGEISFTVKDGSEEYIDVNAESGKLTIKKVPADGKAYVIVTAAETADYVQATKEVTVTIKKPSAVPATVTANDRTYDGTEKPLVTVTGEAEGGEMQYVIGKDGETAPTTGWNADIPAKTDTGTYYVWFKAAGDDDHSDSDPDNVKAEITTVDKTELEEAIADAKEFYDSIKDDEKYDKIASILKQAIEDAEAVYNNDNVTEAKVSKAVEDITEAEDNAELATAMVKVFNELNDIPDNEKLAGLNKLKARILVIAYDVVSDPVIEAVEKQIGRAGVKMIADLEKALKVTDRIDDLQTLAPIDAGDADAIDLARTAYELLTPAQKAMIADETLTKLTKAETDLAAAKAQDDLQAAKAAAVGRLEDYAAAKALTDMTADEKEAYEGVVDAEIKKINEAKKIEDVAAALTEAKTVVDGAIDIITTVRAAAAEAAAKMEAADKALEAAKEAADDALAAAAQAAEDEYASAEDEGLIATAEKTVAEKVKAAADLPKDADADDKNAAAKAIEDAVKELEAVTDTANVNSAAARAKAEAEARQAKELSDAKTAAIGRLEDYSEAKALSDMTEAEKAIYDQPVTDGKAAINAATTKAAIDTALKEAKAAVNEALAQIEQDRADTKAVKTVTVNTSTVTAKALSDAVESAGGSSKYVTNFVLSSKVKKISKGAFKKYKKVKTLTVKTKKLKKAKVKQSLKGSKITKIKVKVGKKKANKKYVKKYKKIFTKKNAGKKAKVTL